MFSKRNTINIYNILRHGVWRISLKTEFRVNNFSAPQTGCIRAFWLICKIIYIYYSIIIYSPSIQHQMLFIVYINKNSFAQRDIHKKRILILNHPILNLLTNNWCVRTQTNRSKRDWIRYSISLLTWPKRIGVWTWVLKNKLYI